MFTHNCLYKLSKIWVSGFEEALPLPLFLATPHSWYHVASQIHFRPLLLSPLCPQWTTHQISQLAGFMTMLLHLIVSPYQKQLINHISTILPPFHKTMYILWKLINSHLLKFESLFVTSFATIHAGYNAHHPQNGTVGLNGLTHK